MTRIVVHSRVGNDGVLHVSIPVGTAEANRQVQVTVEPASNLPATPEEWRAWVESTAGSWRGEFERPEQGDCEQRDELR
jgi:hypothetical protein